MTIQSEWMVVIDSSQNYSSCRGSKFGCLATGLHLWLQHVLLPHQSLPHSALCAALHSATIYLYHPSSPDDLCCLLPPTVAIIHWMSAQLQDVLTKCRRIVELCLPKGACQVWLGKRQWDRADCSYWTQDWRNVKCAPNDFNWNCSIPDTLSNNCFT